MALASVSTTLLIIHLTKSFDIIIWKGQAGNFISPLNLNVMGAFLVFDLSPNFNATRMA